jgi:hypothetical protein
MVDAPGQILNDSQCLNILFYFHLFYFHIIWTPMPLSVYMFCNFFLSVITIIIIVYIILLNEQKFRCIFSVRCFAICC